MNFKIIDYFLTVTVNENTQKSLQKIINIDLTENERNKKNRNKYKWHIHIQLQNYIITGSLGLKKEEKCQIKLILIKAIEAGAGQLSGRPLAS